MFRSIILSKGSLNYRRTFSTSAAQPATPKTIPKAKPSKVRVLESHTNDPYINLAAEEWIFKSLDPNIQTLFLWRNGPSVIIGRNQNPWKECNLQTMLERGVNLVRRQSGGGAVFQDLGNSIFTFVSAKDSHNKDRNTLIITNALRKHFSIEAEPSGRNDILASGKKFSGSAYKLAGNGAIHHGTIMLDVDVNALQYYLNPNKEKLLSKGVASVKQRVVNLHTLNPNITHQALNKALTEEFFEMYENRCEVEQLDANALENIPAVKEHANFLRDWKWRFGETPSFNHNLEKRFDWGIMDINLLSEDGLIKEVKIFSDSLYPQMIDALREAMIGATYDAAGITSAVSKARAQMEGTGCEIHLDDLLVWLLERM